MEQSDNPSAGGMVFISLVLTSMQIFYLLVSAMTCKGGCPALSFGHLVPAGIVAATWFVNWVAYRVSSARLKWLLAFLLVPSVLISTISSFLLIATFAQGVVSWVTKAPDKFAYESAQRTVLERHCQQDTFERVQEVAEGVRGILRVDVNAPGRFFVGGIDGGTSHPHYMFFRLGLEFIEFELDSDEREKHGTRFGRFNLRDSRRNYSYNDEPGSTLVVTFEHAGSIEEERMGVLGRKITVSDAITGRVLGEQQGWLGRQVGGCRDASKQWRGHMSLLSKVINPVSYRCMSNEVSGSIEDGTMRLVAIRACEEQFFANHK